MKTVINIKADKEVKEQAVETARQIGLPLSAVMNAFLKQFIAEKQVTFSVPLRPTKWLQKLLRETEEDWKKGKNYEGPFSSAHEMIKSLKS